VFSADAFKKSQVIIMTEIENKIKNLQVLIGKGFVILWSSWATTTSSKYLNTKLQ